LPAPADRLGFGRLPEETFDPALVWRFLLQPYCTAPSIKDFVGEVLVPYYFIKQGGIRPVSQGAPNGLEDPEDR
jgi:hypothetical protein